MRQIKSLTDKVIANEDIAFEQMRVVFTDPVTNKSKHEILDRESALELAREQGLDLILVSGDAHPPVCKLAKFGHVLLELEQKEKEKRVSQKAQTVREMTMTVGIDQHDFRTKMDKVRSFLDEETSVKIALHSKRRAFSRAAIARQGRNTVTTSISDMDEATMQILMYLENAQVMVQQNDFHADIPCPPHVEGAVITPVGPRLRVHQRREFLVTPKKGKAQKTTKADEK